MSSGLCRAVYGLAAAIALHGSASAAPDMPIQILFLGNSYTQQNDLAGMVAALAQAHGRTVVARSHTMDGATLERLWSLRTTEYVAAETRWDFVVLQDQSTLPLTAPDRMLTSIRTIAAAMQDRGARLVLFATWARKTDPQSQSKLDAAYQAAASTTGTRVAPVGRAWQLALEADTQMPLYASDGSHPSPTGSYIAACTIYLVLTPQRSECPPLRVARVREHHAAIGRKAAAHAVAGR